MRAWTTSCGDPGRVLAVSGPDLAAVVVIAVLAARAASGRRPPTPPEPAEAAAPVPGMELAGRSHGGLGRPAPVESVACPAAASPSTTCCPKGEPPRTVRFVLSAAADRADQKEVLPKWRLPATESTGGHIGRLMETVDTNGIPPSCQTQAQWSSLSVASTSIPWSELRETPSRLGLVQRRCDSCVRVRSVGFIAIAVANHE